MRRTAPIQPVGSYVCRLNDQAITVPTAFGSQQAGAFDIKEFNELPSLDRLKFMRDHPELGDVIAEAKAQERIDRKDQARANRGKSLASRAEAAKAANK